MTRQFKVMGIIPRSCHLTYNFVLLCTIYSVSLRHKLTLHSRHSIFYCRGHCSTEEDDLLFRPKILRFERLKICFVYIFIHAEKLFTLSFETDVQTKFCAAPQHIPDMPNIRCIAKRCNLTLSFSAGRYRRMLNILIFYQPMYLCNTR